MSGACDGDPPGNPASGNGTEHEALHGFPRTVFLGRRQRVLDALGAGAMVLPAAPPLVRSRDATLRYRPSSELFYLTGLTDPGALLVLRGFANGNRSVLFARSRNPRAEAWSGLRTDPEEVGRRTGVDEVRPAGRIRDHLGALLAGADRIFFRLGTDSAVEGQIRKALEVARARGARRGTGPRGILDPGLILDDLRLRKDASEIQAIRAAVDITATAVRAAVAHLRPGIGEWELEAELEAGFRRLGASGPAFASIVGSGPNGCILHYVENSRRMWAGDLVLIDAGAEARMYAGDISRTFPVSGSFSPEQADVYQLVDAARRAAIRKIRPGTVVSEVHEAAVATLTEGLRQLGVTGGDGEGAADSGAHERFFPHQTSHWLGIDVHDVGDYATHGVARRLEEGMVLTVEPGLYFGPGAPAGPFEGIGIRIEDDVLVTGEGAEVLSAALPTGSDKVAAVVGRPPGG